MKVKIKDLQELARIALRKYHYTPEETEIILEVLMYAQLRGTNQGLVKLIGKGIPKSPDAKEISIEKETKLSVLLNGNRTHSMIVFKNAVARAVEKAKEHGLAIIGTNNTNTSAGSIGYFANEIAKQGLIGFVFAGSVEKVSTYSSYQPIFGTNPLAMGVPSDGEPIVLDMATAAMATYGLIEAKTANQSLPHNTAYDTEGNETTNPSKALEGATMPFVNNPKGAGLAMIVEILTGPLVSASFTGIGDTANNWGNLVFAIDPELLTNTEQFKKNVSLLAEKVKATKKLPGVKEIFIPGERGNKLTKERLSSGEMEIEDNLYNELKKVAES